MGSASISPHGGGNNEILRFVRKIGMFDNHRRTKLGVKPNTGKRRAGANAIRRNRLNRPARADIMVVWFYLPCFREMIPVVLSGAHPGVGLVRFVFLFLRFFGLVTPRASDRS